MRLAPILALGAAASLIAAACDDEGESPPTSLNPPSSSVPTSAAPVSDDRLTIGLLLPQGANSIGDPMIAAARGAADAIRDEGQLVPEHDLGIRIVEAAEGADATEAEAAIDTLLRQRVDAIVGPSSSNTTLGSLDKIVDAGVLSCSPTASSLLLDSFPDDNLFFRSIASDSLQAMAIARLTLQTGGREVVIAYLDDLYGRGLLDSVRDALAAVSITPLPDVAISPDDESLEDQADAALRNSPDVVIVLADNREGPRMLAALSNARLRQNPDDEIPSIVVNDAIRRPDSLDVIRDLRAELRDNIQGVSPSAAPPESGLVAPIDLRGNFSVNAYNCVTTIALASLVADSDVPSDIAAQLLSVTTLGQSCYDFAGCAALYTDDDNFNYEGPDRFFDLDSDGNVSRSRFDVFRFDEAGVDTTTGTEVIDIS